MTVADLIAELEQFDGELEVRLGTQSNYPFESKISHVIDTESIVSDEDEDDEDSSSEDDNVVYICEGSQVGYFTKRAWSR